MFNAALNLGRAGTDTTARINAVWKDCVLVFGMRAKLWL